MNDKYFIKLYASLENQREVADSFNLGMKLFEKNIEFIVAHQYDEGLPPCIEVSTLRGKSRYYLRDFDDPKSEDAFNIDIGLIQGSQIAKKKARKR